MILDYLDTSVIVRLLTNEGPKSQALTDWFENLPLQSRAISPWVITEFSSSLARKLREGVVNAAGRAAALAMFNDLRQRFRMLTIDPQHFSDAAGMIDRTRHLRSPDVLHLAIARGVGARVWTFDADLVRAAEELSLLAAIPAL